VLTLLAFAHANVESYACTMDRGATGPAMTIENHDAGADCDRPMVETTPQSASLCVLHCTSDLQATGTVVALVGAPADLRILGVVRDQAAIAPRTGLLAPPPGAPPHRIFLHSFLI